MDTASPRWQGIRSTFSWEQDALQHIKAQVPDAEPYRARQTFTFTAKSGHIREVDLFIATPGGLFLVEIKSHPGRATNNGSTWIFTDNNGVRRTVENPLHFTDAKAKELKELLDKAARDHHIREAVPRIEAVVFLSAENLRCRFDDFQRPRVFGRDGLEDQTGLKGIWHGFLNQPPRNERNRVTPSFSKQLPKLLKHIGVRDLTKLGKVGPYELEPRSFATGPTWEDYLARNSAMPDDAPRRVRIFLSERTATEQERESTNRAARREYQALQGISHEGIVRAEQFSNELFIGPAVVFAHGKGWQSLDQFMAVPPFDLPLETRLEMIAQLADAVAHAHRRHLYHRALAARSVYVELDGRYPRLHIADWQVAARPGGTPQTATALATPTSLAAHLERGVGPYLAPEFANQDADAARLDVFGLGALSYLILTGQPPADTREHLGQRLQSERALAPSTVIDSISPSIDELVRDATAISPADRTGSVQRFRNGLEAIEEELTAPDREPVKDPLEAGRNDEINGWTVKRVLGKGSTSKALLVTKDGYEKVFKIALNDAAARRLVREAEQLGQLIDSHVARLLDPPFEWGSRTLIGVEYVGDHTLADVLRRRGPLPLDSIHELERLGEDLFQAMKFLDAREIWHRDIKPDNLALRTLERKGRELVLFDFSLAGAKDTDLELGTKDYLDPFLGQGRRDRYDQAAELYAVAVTLHEMASGELPSWGDGLIPSNLLDPDEEVQLAEDVFDPVIRDGLVRFFHTALNRDAKQRYPSLRAMTRAWMDIFRDVKTQPPLTTASTLDDEPEDVKKARENAQRKATLNTPLAAAGLSPFALSISQQKLNVSTAGELARVPARRITRLRGIGSEPRYELIRVSRDWRVRFRLSETQFQAKTSDSKTTDASPHGPDDSAPSHLSVDAVVRRLVPDSTELRRVLGLAPVAGTGTLPVSPWADQKEITRLTGLTDAEVVADLDRLRNRWAKSVPELTQVREDIAAILREHGRVLGWKPLAAALLTRRGSELVDPEARLAQAAVCVRAAVETEERLDSPALVAHRVTGDRVLIAVTGVAEDSVPSAEDLFVYAELLGGAADELSAKDPLPGGSEIQASLRDVPTADHAIRLSDIDLVQLAAAASRNTAATARLELYPLDLSPERAVKLSQVGSFVGGMNDAELARKVLVRFPELVNPPKPEQMNRLLHGLGYEVTRGADGKLHARSATERSKSTGTAKPARSNTATRLGLDPGDYTRDRLAGAARDGGFLTVKVRVRDVPGTVTSLAVMDEVTPVNVSSEFVRLLREVWTEQGRPPRWESVLAADSSEASVAAKAGFGGLVRATWDRFDAHVRAIGNGIVLLHDATPLARYTGGSDLLARLAVAARQSGESPFGLWLLCPMQDPKGLPLLDDMTVGVIPGDAEQLIVRSSFGTTQRRAS